MTTTLATLSQRLQETIGDGEGMHSSKYTDAINAAARETYHTLFRYLRDLTLVTGNALPNSSFEDWAATTIPDLYTASTGGCLVNTTAAYVRGQRGSSSCKVTASGADDYMYITSNDYPRLLDLMDTDIDFKCWVYPSTANDAWIQIYTIQADGTEQELPASHTAASITAPASKFTLLELEDQSINDDIVEIQFRFAVHSTGQNVYFDSARLTGKNIYDYLLPTNFKNGALCSAGWFPNGDCDDLHLKGNSTPLWGWDTYNDGTYEYLHTDKLLTSNRTLELVGYCPLEDDLDADAETMSIDGEQVNLLIMYAAHLLYERLRGVPATGDISRIEDESKRWLAKYNYAKGRLGMIKPHVQMNVRSL